MPQFELNADRYGKHPFYKLDDFAKGYVEAMFFTDCDTGREEDEGKANELGVEKITHASILAIAADCAAFQQQAADILDEVTAGASEYDMTRAGNDFWFTRQGHGVGFWDREELKFEDRDFGEELTKIARSFGEAYPEIYRGRIYYR